MTPEKAETMTTDRTGVGQEIEAALREVVAHVRGEAALPCRVVEAPPPTGSLPFASG